MLPSYFFSSFSTTRSVDEEFSTLLKSPSSFESSGFVALDSSVSAGAEVDPVEDWVASEALEDAPD